MTIINRSTYRALCQARPFKLRVIMERAFTICMFFSFFPPFLRFPYSNFKIMCRSRLFKFYARSSVCGLAVCCLQFGSPNRFVVSSSFRLLLCGDCLFFRQPPNVRPVSNGSAPFRATRPNRLTFNGLISNYFRLHRRLFVNRLTSSVGYRVLMFRSMVSRIVQLSTLLCRASRFICRSFFRTLIRTTNSFLPARFPISIRACSRAIRLKRKAFIC